MSHMNFREVIEEEKRMSSEIEEVERSLKILRKGHQEWERGIDHDERLPVKLLLKELRDRREARAEFLSTCIVRTEMPPRQG